MNGESPLSGAHQTGSNDHRDLIAWGPVDEVAHRVEATIVNLSAALLNEIEIIVAVEAAIVQLEQAARFLKVVRR